MSAPQKLTKKQKKGLAFRDRKSGKSRSHAGPADLEDNEVPLLEVQDLVDDEVDSPALEAGTTKAASLLLLWRQRRGKETMWQMWTRRNKKQKSKGPSRKKPKETRENRRKKAKTQVTQRFILFVGNLKYTTTAEAIKAHFAACDPPPTVRLRTPKPSTSGKSVTKSKGCAFVEFSHRNALQQGLKLHQSELEGRRINVELTVGGGGKSDTRLNKLKERNKGLFEQRKTRVEKLAKKDPTMSSVLDLPQRFSATSGLEQVQSKRRTWTVGDVEEDETHRGGKKHTKSRGKGKAKQWGTGVNAIPVG
ncbi:RRM domain-containing protein [Mycena sanguinolenta]|uniref:RRM domain-containing protein n=1 Tax=Mycena sanguinolenta TaxID=230812 RepID=A0A8H6XF45_9AGAR|nr:RRM domain-containing protein [Mycena sanguinolenta]